LLFKVNRDRRHRIPKQTAPDHQQLGCVRHGFPCPWQPDCVVYGRGGRGGKAELAIATALTLRAVFRLALHQTEG
jgi:hypothetical protein